MTKGHFFPLLVGLIMIVLGVVVVVYPLISGVAFIVTLGWVMMIAGIVNLFTLLGGRDKDHFWLSLVSAMLGIIVGFLLVENPGIGLMTVTMMLIIYLAIDGVAHIVLGFSAKGMRNRSWVILSGVLSVVLAVILWTDLPEAALWLIGILVGANLIAFGAALAGLAWTNRSAEPPAG